MFEKIETQRLYRLRNSWLRVKEEASILAEAADREIEQRKNKPCSK